MHVPKFGSNSKRLSLRILFLLAGHTIAMGFPASSVGKESAMQETLIEFLGWEDPLEKE